MSTNCINCATAKRTGTDLLCDDCRAVTLRAENAHLRRLNAQLAEIAKTTREMKDDLKILAGRIGERNVMDRPSSLAAAADFLGAELIKAGYPVNRQSYQTDGQTCENLEVEITGSDLAKEIVVVGLKGLG